LNKGSEMSIHSDCIITLAIMLLLCYLSISTESVSHYILHHLIRLMLMSNL